MLIMKSDKPDYFMSNPEKLKEGAKVALARLVKDKISGLYVPEIYADVEHAISSGKPIVIRSDHPKEYDGLAGVLNSAFGEIQSGRLKFTLHEGGRFNDYFLGSSEDLQNLRPKIIDQDPIFQRYLKLTGQDKEEFFRGFNFTFWEIIQGVNGTMWADPVIPNKYHFVQFNFEDGNAFIHYTRLNTSTGVSESNGSSGRLEDKIPGGADTLRKLIDSYEEIRGMSQFNGNHCYEMEYQLGSSGNLWFLQWRRMRDFSPTDFKLERGAEEGEVEGSFAIGKTSGEGFVLKTQHTKSNEGINPDVEAITTMESPLASIRYPNAQAVLYNHSSFDYFVIRGFTHSSRELIGNVNLITHLPYPDKKDLDILIERPLRYISDGERCLIKRM